MSDGHRPVAALRRAAARVLGLLLMLVLVLALIGTGWQWLAERDSRARHPAPGRLVGLDDGRAIHLREWGQPDGGPTIILDGAASLPSSAWALVAGELASTYHVVAYDRPGIGWSRGGHEPRDARTAAEALDAALSAAGHEPPYIVVAHSYGGFSARMFAHLRADAVRALVLIDTTHEDAAGSRGYGALYRMSALQNHLGLNQLSPPGNGYAGLPAAEAEAAHAVSLWTSHMDATADELEAWPASAAQLREAGGLGDLPLLVIAAYGSEPQYEHQRDLARLSTAGEYVALDVWHTSLLFDVEHARLVAGEIRRFIERSADAPRQPR